LPSCGHRPCSSQSPVSTADLSSYVGALAKTHGKLSDAGRFLVSVRKQACPPPGHLNVGRSGPAGNDRSRDSPQGGSRFGAIPRAQDVPQGPRFGAIPRARGLGRSLQPAISPSAYPNCNAACLYVAACPQTFLVVASHVLAAPWLVITISWRASVSSVRSWCSRYSWVAAAGANAEARW